MRLFILLNQFRKFAIVGLLSTAVNYLVFFILFQYVHLHYALSHVVGYFLGVVVGYLFNRTWTFVSVIQKQHLEFALYVSVYALSLITSVSVLQILVELGHLHPLVANILSIGVSTVMNYVGCKLFVFNHSMVVRLRHLGQFLTFPFWILVAFKLVSSALFGSHYLVKGFLPFVSYFSATLQNPYVHFSVTSGISPFPYPGGMLAVVSLPFAIVSRVIPPQWFDVHMQMLVVRLPVLLADIAIYLLLCLLLPTKSKKVLWLYFASPLFFYISYYHGQLDAIPTAILFASLLALLKKKLPTAFLLLGLGIAVKTHLLAAAPFFLIYLYKNRVAEKSLAYLSLLSLGVFLLLNPFLGSGEFIRMVFDNPEQKRLLDLVVSFNYNNLTVFLAPAAIVLIFFRFASFKKLNWDSLLLALGLTYLVLVALVPPMQGWFYWSLPFLVFFFIKYRESNHLWWWALNALSLLYFALIKDSDIFESLAPLAPSLAELPTPFARLQAAGVDPGRAVSLLFTVLEAFLVAASLWAYKVSVANTESYQSSKKHFLLGIAGDSGAGKSTLGKLIEQITGKTNSVLLAGDDVHRWQRTDDRWQYVTHLNPAGNKIHTDLEHALALLRGERIERLSYDHGTGTFLGPLSIEPKRFIIFQGLMPFLLSDMRQLQDLKIYVEAEENLRNNWKLFRDSQERSRTPEEVERQLQQRKPDAEKYIWPQKDFADWVIRYIPGSSSEVLQVEHTMRSSVNLEHLLELLAQEPGVELSHSYPDIHKQKLTLNGFLPHKRIQEIAYSAYPNLYDLLEHEPEFQPGLNGLTQLLFLSHLHSFNRSRQIHGQIF